MIKLLIYIAIGYFVLKAVKGVFGYGAKTRMGPVVNQHNEIDDLMVKDPNCHTYIPKREAVLVEQNGEALYFCSDKCRDAYLMNS